MNFQIYDLILLAIFVIFVSFFLYKNRKNLKREGLLFLYRTKWGMKLIDSIGKKYKKTLKFLSYISITLGYLLMGFMLYLFGKIVYIYVALPSYVQAIKVPPITPIFPYMDKVIPGFPPFYFIYFILILAIIAIFHEFAHGIFMRRYDIKIKSTGFGFFPFFLPIFLAAFVEQDEKSMEKKSPFKQMAVLSAGTFANLLTAIVSFGILVLIISTMFSPAGVNVVPDNNVLVTIPLINITGINNISLNNPTYQNLLENVGNKTSILETQNKKYIINKEILENKNITTEKSISAYLYSPVSHIGINKSKNIVNRGAFVIRELDGQKISSVQEISKIISQYSIGDNATIKTNKGEHKIIFQKNPYEKNKAWLGVFVLQRPVIEGHKAIMPGIGKPGIYYEAKSNAGIILENFFEWLVLISFGVALINMLPMGIFDGGRFFYLTIFALTKSEKKAKNWFRFSTNFLLFLVLLIMVFWVLSFL